MVNEKGTYPAVVLVCCMPGVCGRIFGMGSQLCFLIHRENVGMFMFVCVCVCVCAGMHMHACMHVW